MNRKTITIKLKEQDYIFSERNNEDVDIFSIQEKIRKKKIAFIQENVNEDNQLPMLIAEMDKFYKDKDIIQYLANDPEEKFKAGFNSFKIVNVGVSFDQFKELAKDKIDEILKLIAKLEGENDKDLLSDLDTYLNQNQNITLEEFIKKLNIQKTKDLAVIVKGLIDKKKITQ